MNSSINFGFLIAESEKCRKKISGEDFLRNFPFYGDQDGSIFTLSRINLSSHSKYYHSKNRNKEKHKGSVKKRYKK